MLYTPAFFAMAIANLCNLASFGTFFLFPLFISNHGGDQADIGVVMGAFALSSVFCRPSISEMIDRIGRKRSFSIGSVCMSVCPLVYVFFRGDLPSFYVPLLLIRLIHGVGFAICLTAAFTYVADLIPPRRLNEGIGIFGVSGLLGTAVGPIIAEATLRYADFQTLFLVAAGMSTVGFLIHFPLSETYVHVSKIRSGSFFSVLKMRRIFFVAILSLLFGFGLAASNNFISPFAHEKGLRFISLFYVAYSSAAILTRLFGGRLGDRLGEKRIIPYALLIMGAGLFSLIFLQGDLMLLVSGFMAGCGHGFLYPSLNVLAIRGEPPHIKGKITGVFTGSIDAGVFGGSIVLGCIGQWIGFPSLFMAAGFALLLAFGIFELEVLTNRYEMISLKKEK
ncbi:MFS transporter [Desulforhabdus amnigena]|jgi:MFS family permease|uniref:MFS transporter n=1 Tax=Desulforhabdus amnigena TaxID=40218 RepID=A0A9W6CW88_9BACT|nr:MFS transporter [Desulforhabdus amnigena]NLJ29047.1 MFS transporter [Deltaproteobacteria bacterium]GLI33704.1 MFS transporter [Desulforhabdus amnigena]